MILAELHGKIPSQLDDKEDLLTSNVFSFFKYTNRRIFMDYLHLLGIKVTLNESQKAEFLFWPTYEDGTEPDLVVICGDYYILFEAKLYSDFSPPKGTLEAQIDREIKMGLSSAKNLYKQFIYVAITGKYNKDKQKFKTYEGREYKFIWTNWRMVATLLFNIQDQNPHAPDMDFIEDLYALLVKKKQRSFIGIRDLIHKVIHLPEHQIFYDSRTARFKGEFTGFIEVLSLYHHIKPYHSIFQKSFFKSLPESSFDNPQLVFYGK